MCVYFFLKINWVTLKFVELYLYNMYKVLKLLSMSCFCGIFGMEPKSVDR